LKKRLIILLFWSTLILWTIPLRAQEDTAADSIPKREYPLMPTEAIDDALSGIKMTANDMGFRTDYVEVDAFRLPLIDSLTENPLAMAVKTKYIADFFLSDSNKIDNYFIEAANVIIRPPENIRALLYDLIVDGGLAESPSRSSHITPPNVDYPDDVSEIDIVSLDQIFLQIYEYLYGWGHDNPVIDSLRRSRFFSAGLEREQFMFLRDSFPILILEDEKDEFRPLEELDSLQKFEEELSKSAIPVCEDLKITGLFSKYAIYLVNFTFLLETMLADNAEYYELFDSKDWQVEKETPRGKIAVGGWGENQYEGEYQFILDLGGNDRYLLDHNDSTQIIIDLDGDDLYIGREDYCLGSGFFSLGILYDHAGDDIYSAGNFAMGSGLFGVGFLIDKEGDDIYLGDTHTQGAGTFGIGMLIDESGNDDYKAALFSQAYAGVQGFGAIIEHNGNDSYYAGGKYKDFLRYEDHYVSLSQGFAFGFRPRMSGGVALLIDSAGHDTYISDIFGQGASYWYGLGALYDIAGNDKYLSFQYAQGSATHLTLAILMDQSGNDYYFSKGVSQGCGHDLAAGYLIDYDGNDTYQAYDLSQAAGSANGMGMLIDYLGDDSYEIKSTLNTQGYGNPRRDYGSIGLFLDLMGEDTYVGNGRDNYYWINDSKWGIGVDREYWEEEEK